jgi:capsular polysaccharide export protein
MTDADAPAGREPAPTAALLPPVVPGWPASLLAASSPVGAGAGSEAALARIRAEALFWPAPRAGARAPRVIAVGPTMAAAARAATDDADLLVLPDGDPAQLAVATPDRLEAVWTAPGALRRWSVLGGVATHGGGAAPDARALLGSAVGRCPWSGATIGLEEAIEAQALLRAAALRARGPLVLRDMTPWKRRCLRPFLTGPDGPPRRARRGDAGPSVRWGAAGPAPDDAVLRVEDGFLRSVGLGLRHTPPLSLAIAPGPPHFDATRRNAFEQTVAAAVFTPVLLARAARLRARLVALGLTKYNLAPGEPLPDPRGREAVLVPGQVATDASIRLGARAVRDDAALLRAARARFPDAFLLYKPHPDVVSGLRRGAAPEAEIAALADATVLRADMADCLVWADRVATITSLTGFEALLRGKPTTTFGRPFYAGWGLTDDVDPPARERRLDLDALTAAALILHPSYVDPATGLPCPPEIAVEALARQRAAAGRPAARLRRLLRDGLSFLMARL